LSSPRPENYPKKASKPLIEVAVRSKDPEIQKLAIHLLSLHRDESAVEPMTKLLDSEDTTAEVRGAVVDLIGLLHASTYPIKTHGSEFGLDCCPVIHPQLRQSDFQVNDSLPKKYRQLLNDIMLSGESSAERIAAARAIVAWPPKDYELRYAEWGVWLDGEGQLKLSKSLLDEIPPFVHQTANPLDSFKDRIKQAAFMFKPIVHLTANQPMAVDLEVFYFEGRPWYAYPRPDDFNLTTPSFYSRIPKAAPKPEMKQLDNSGLESLQPVREGYPWLLPRNRMHRISGARRRIGTANIFGVGLRWQSLIVSPEKLTWMQEPATPAAPKYKWWDGLRDVDCSWISSLDESEKFLFFDGPTLAKSPLKIDHTDSKLTATSQLLFENHNFSEKEGQKERDGFFIEVEENGAVKGQPLRLPGKGIPEPSHASVDLPEAMSLSGDQVRESMLATLLKAGLKDDEANGLLDSWQTPFFESPGRRVIFLLTPLEYDMMIRMQCRPKPTEIVRVGLVMKELTSE